MFTDLEQTAGRVREHILHLGGRGGCFVGASLSAVEIMVYLYGRKLRFTGPADPHRDRFLLSKGHDVPALYGTLVEFGHLDPERLDNHLSPDDHLYWHPNTHIPFVEFHSGSLGHLLSVGLGIALDAKMRGASFQTYVLLGDGELNEGSNWEALLVAKAYGLDNLTLIIDRNGFQANARTEELIPLEPLTDKLAAFGAEPRVVDGHDFAALERGLGPSSHPGPRALIAQTQRGRGLPSLVDRADRWFCNFSPNEVSQLLRELHGEVAPLLEREAEVVR